MMFVEIGEIPVYFNDIKLIESANDFYVCKDVEKFENSGKKHEQKIIRRFGNNFLLGNNHIVRTMGDQQWLFEKYPAYKKLMENFPDEPDDKLKSLFNFILGSDTSNEYKKFINTTKVLEWKELEQTKGGLSAGLGFPGASASVLVIQDDFFGKMVFIQLIRSYMEGYVIEHTRIDKDLFYLINLKEVKELLE